eukprot:GHRQ01017095.1.p4 GENE.GHRQ01017095.1~~GHRQ01017095.1.p4  ORF type:complete len:118 (+),score=44.99 GHRQ01017095.1:1786-2139(+)
MLIPAAAEYACTPMPSLQTSGQLPSLLRLRSTCRLNMSCKLLLCRRDAFTMNMLEIPQGAGSGFIWDDAGQQLLKDTPSMFKQELRQHFRPASMFTQKFRQNFRPFSAACKLCWFAP